MIVAASLLEAKQTIRTREDLKAVVTAEEFTQYEERASKHRAGLMIVAVQVDGTWVGNLAL